MLTGTTLADAGIDAAALKPAEVDLTRATALDVDLLTVDYEGRDHFPSAETLSSLADEHAVRITTPVRADGFDPLGDDSLLSGLPDGVGRVLVAGHEAYLTPEEYGRAVAPRLRAAAEAARDPWVGTESVERLALAVGGTQFELLSASTGSDIQALREAGYDGDVAVYAPTVLTDDEDAILDAVGAYVARRPSVGATLPDDAVTDSGADGEVRARLLRAAREYALVGSVTDVRERVDALRECGVDTVVGYPARGLDPLVE
ncbi:MAG: luciferase [Haloarculaceae archaeon]